MRGIDLKDHESIVCTVRQHWLVYIRSWLCVALLLTLTSYGLFWLLSQGVWGQIGAGMGYMLGIVCLLRTLIYWRSTRLVITTNRIIDIDRQSLFHTEITQINIPDIDEVVGQIKGVFGTIFRIGQIRIIPHRGSAIILTHIAAPVHVQDIVLDIMEQKEVARSLAQMTPKSVLGYLETLETTELDALLRSAMGILRKKKMQE